MAVASSMVPLGTPAPDFRLPSVQGPTVARRDLDSSPVLLVAFLCSHCPYVRHIESVFGALASEYERRGVATVGICSNDTAAYPDDAPPGLSAQASRAGFSFPYLVDDLQDVAQAYGAVCTPDLFVYDAQRRLTYRGEFDGARPGNDTPVTGSTLRAALDLVLDGKPMPEPHPSSLGCGLKWKPGNEPT